MRVTHVSIGPSEAAQDAGRPILSPELLAAVGARYSRNPEGLERILEKVKDLPEQQAVETIFRFVDYGHQSIADMAPVAMFMDGLSLWLIYWIWSRCPTASGQETSTRYLRFDQEGLVDPEILGIPPHQREEWFSLMGESFEAYNQALTFWGEVFERHPELARIPTALREQALEGDEKARKQVDRMKRNYVFDRARYWIPAACQNNMMLVQSARAWVELCQQLLSHPVEEFRQAGTLIREELKLVSPNLIRHATEKKYFYHGLRYEIVRDQEQAVRSQSVNPLMDEYGSVEGETLPYLFVYLPPDYSWTQLDQRFVENLVYHENRYSWVGPDLKQTAVRFGWRAVALAELRDLNRHRTGTKRMISTPSGFYGAMDQLPESGIDSFAHFQILTHLGEVGRRVSRRALDLLKDQREPTHIYWTLLGTQFPFEHLTTGEKFIYEMELRTGVGAHFRYAQHCRDILSLWYDNFPKTEGLILEGSAEPE
jgi:thymidylate synthase ThyX